MLTAADLAYMQTTAGGLQTTPCTIQRNTPTSDGLGGQTWAWATLATTLCYLAPVVQTDQEVIEDQRLEVLNRVLIYLPAGTDVTERDRIVALGLTYEVTSVDAPRTVEITRVVECMKVVS